MLQENKGLRNQKWRDPLIGIGQHSGSALISKYQDCVAMVIVL